jgi:uncharacterized protein
MSADRSDPTRPFRDMRVSLGAVQDGAMHEAISFTTGSPDVLFAVARGEVDVAAINPSAYAAMAVRGTGLFPSPLSVRTVAVMPSWDRMGFAVSDKFGLTSLADLAALDRPLRISIRENPNHGTRFVIDEALGALGLTLSGLRDRGVEYQYISTPSEETRLAGMRDGTLDAVFDEGIKGWGSLALHHGYRFLGLGTTVRERFEQLGWPVGSIPADRLPGVSPDAEGPSFSGWPIVTRADLREEWVYQMCAALDAARGDVDWDTDHPVTTADLCRDDDAAPLGSPLHPGAERYYREHGALQ